MSRIKFVSVASSIAAVVFWVLALVTLLTPSMQAEGRMALTAVLAGTATVIAAIYRLLLAFRRLERRNEERERRREESDRDRTLLITTLAGAVPAPRRDARKTEPLRRVL